VGICQPCLVVCSQAATRLAFFAMVARLQPVARWIMFQDCSAVCMAAMALLRSVSSRLPLDLSLGPN